MSVNQRSGNPNRTSKNSYRTVAALAAAACLLIPALAAPAAGAQTAPDTSASAEDIELRDQLIANQEALLNTYRCLFNTDTHAVPGGCANNAPSQPAQPPTPFTGEPTTADIALRDQLIADQEALLNTYRCLFNTDTHAVPGGCANTPPDPTPQPTPDPTPDPYSGIWAGVFDYSESDYSETAAYLCALNPDNTVACSINETRVASPDTPLTNIAVRSHSSTEQSGDGEGSERSVLRGIALCGLRADQTIACWYWDQQRDDDGNTIWTLVEEETPPGSFANIASIKTYGDVIRNSSVFWCGSRADQTIACWDWDQQRDDDGNTIRRLVELETPAGIADIDSIKNYGGVWCGSRADQTIACWYWDRQRDDDGNTILRLVEVETPAGIADIDSIKNYGNVYGSVWCGSRADQTIACWYWGWQRDDDGNRIRDDDGNTIRRLVELETPAGIADIDSIKNYGNVYGSVWCGSRADQTIACWDWEQQYDGGNFLGWRLVEVETPAGINSIKTYGDVIRNLSVFWCGSRADQTIACWGWDRQRDDDGNTILRLVEVETPAGIADIDSIKNYGSVWCGSRADQTIACWYWGWQRDDDGNRIRDDDGNTIRRLVELETPAGIADIDSIKTLGSVWCGSRADQTIACWDWDQQRDDDGNTIRRLVEVETPAGIADIDSIKNYGGVYGSVWCGSRADQTIACWYWATERDDDGNTIRRLVELETPAGIADIDSIKTLGSVWCGSRADQTIACWDWDQQRDDDGNTIRRLVEVETPAGIADIDSIKNYGGVWCGSRADQTIACWYWVWQRDDDGNFIRRLVEFP